MPSNVLGIKPRYSEMYIMCLSKLVLKYVVVSDGERHLGKGIPINLNAMVRTMAGVCSSRAFGACQKMQMKDPFKIAIVRKKIPECSVVLALIRETKHGDSHSNVCYVP